MTARRVALIGANGQLGTDLRAVLAHDPAFEVVALTHADVEVADVESVRAVLDAVRPAIVVNTAAYHKLEEVEANPERGFLVNGIANRNLAQLCHERGAVLVFLSTDFVFGLDRTRRTPYVETDPCGAVNTYGVTKIAGENFVRAFCPRSFVVRSCGLFGAAGSRSRGGNFVDTMLRLGRERGQVSVVADQVVTPTATADLARQLAALISTDAYGLYHATAHGACSWFEFTRAIFELAGLGARVEPLTAAAFGGPVERPQYSVLDNRALRDIGLDRMRPWQEGLADYLAAKGLR